MTLDPKELVAGVGRRAHEPATVRPPSLLSRSAEPPPRLRPIRESEEVQQVHRRWASLHTITDGTTSMARPAATSRVVAKARAWAASAAAALGVVGLHDDGELVGDLIRAVDALASRCDQLADRLAAVEALFPELVASLGQDLVQLRAAIDVGGGTSTGVGTQATPPGKAGGSTPADD